MASRGRYGVALLAALALLLTACTGSEAPDRRVRAGGDTLFGSNVWEAPGETAGDAMARLSATYGRLPVTRLFTTWPPPTWDTLERAAGSQAVVVSFRLPPATVLSGVADDRLLTWFRNAPADRDVYWVYFHEPEDQVERGYFTATEFADAWSHIARLADQADHPRLHATMVLMCWTASERSGRDWRGYVPASGAVEVLAWDCYAKGHDAGSYADPTDLLEPARQASAAAGADWGIAELGARLAAGADGVDRARWLAEVAAYADRQGARFVTYFNAPVGGEFRLTDPTSIRTWAELVRSSERQQRHGRRHEGEPV